MVNKMILLLAAFHVSSGSETVQSKYDGLVGTTFGDFMTGLIWGIQDDPNNPSNCVKSYPKVTSSFSTFIETFQTLNVDTIFNLISNFNTFVNQFVASYDICNYSDLSKMYLSGKSTAILNFLINFTGNIQDVVVSLQNLLNVLGTTQYLDIGLNLGMLLRYSLGISL